MVTSRNDTGSNPGWLLEGNSKKYLTSYPKYAILVSKRWSETQSTPSTALPFCPNRQRKLSPIHHCGQLSPSWLNRGCTLKTKQCWQYASEPLMGSASGVVAYGTRKCVAHTECWVREYWCYWRATARQAGLVWAWGRSDSTSAVGILWKTTSAT